MEFVTIGSPGNTADTTGDPNPAGSVGYTYSMGVNEVSRDMVTKANSVGGLGITLDSMSFVTGGPRQAARSTCVAPADRRNAAAWRDADGGLTERNGPARRPEGVG